MSHIQRREYVFYYNHNKTMKQEMELEASAAKTFWNRNFKAVLSLLSLLIVCWGFFGFWFLWVVFFFFAKEEIWNFSHWKEDIFLSSLVTYEVFCKRTGTVTRKSPPVMQTLSFWHFSISKALQTLWTCRKYNYNKSQNLHYIFIYELWTIYINNTISLQCEVSDKYY